MSARPDQHDWGSTVGTSQKQNASNSYIHTPTRRASINGLQFAYRRLGPEEGIPVVFVHHLGGNLDEWDPRVVDGIAARHPVITFDNRGVGASEGKTPQTVAEMARDAIAFIRTLGYEQVDLLGFSLGGFVSQVIAQQEPQLVRKLILAGTGPAGGVGIAKINSVAIGQFIKAALTFRHPKRYLFFTQTANGQQAARAFLGRLKERKTDRDKAASGQTTRAHLKAVRAWGLEKPHDLSTITQPVLVANGESDAMVPTSNSNDLARRLPHSELVLYPDAGHGGIFQFHDAFVAKALEFYES
ncbi:alpha/beta fold hydrolase [Streptomyces chartreusis]|uniref:alpha/beta fold hydrolase n=1 Tax=Streptomyces chartreusis TaxID=1969 RepID=UPI00362C4BF7